MSTVRPKALGVKGSLRFADFWPARTQRMLPEALPLGTSATAVVVSGLGFRVSTDGACFDS